jgi:arabinogalactan oligomer/maltooligosaccharide transport system substrate-binding protein
MVPIGKFGLNIVRCFGIALAALATTLVESQVRASTVELVFWEHEYDEIQKSLDTIFSDFEKANPGIKIKRSHFKTEDLRTQFQTAALGGGGADLVLAPNDFGGAFSIMGIIQPVNDWIVSDRFVDGAIQGVSDQKGKIWGVPISRGNHLLLLVNKKYLAKAPETIEELVKEASRIGNTSKGLYGFAYNLTEPFWFVSFMGAYGESPLVNGKPKLDSQGMVDALTLVHGLKFKDKIVPTDCDYSCADTLFVDGKAAMIINGDWELDRYRKSLGDNLVIAPLPKLAATGKPMVPYVSGKYIFLNSRLKGPRLDAAKKFVEYLLSTQGQEKLIQSTRRLPALKAMEENPVVTSDPILQASRRGLINGQPMPMDIELRAVWDAIRPQLQAVMAGRTAPKEAVAVMQKDVDTKIKELKM